MHNGKKAEIRAEPAPVQPIRGRTQHNVEPLSCGSSGVASNNFSYVDFLALVCPSAAALNDLLRLPDEFARKHYIKFSTAQSVCMCIPRKRAAPDASGHIPRRHQARIRASVLIPGPYYHS